MAERGVSTAFARVLRRLGGQVWGRFMGRRWGVWIISSNMFSISSRYLDWIMPGYHCSAAGRVFGGSAGIVEGEGTLADWVSCADSLAGGDVCRGVATNWDMLPTNRPRKPRRGVDGAAIIAFKQWLGRERVCQKWRWASCSSSCHRHM